MPGRMRRASLRVIVDAGEDPYIAQYLIQRSRAVGLPWAYGGNPAVLSQYVKVGQGGPRKRARL